MSDLDLVPFVFIGSIFIMLMLLCFIDYRINTNDINMTRAAISTNTNTNTNIRTNFLNEPLPKYEQYELPLYTLK